MSSVSPALNEMFVSYSQNGEDVLLNRVFRDLDDGFYVDVGAYHPVIGSVTKAFYDRGWSGINIEPGEVFVELAAARPRDINLRMAVLDYTGQVSFLEAANDSGMSRVAAAETLDGAAGTVRQADCDTLANILAGQAPGRVPDFIKIDAEGSEAAIIGSTDWRAIRPAVLVIEATCPWTNDLANEVWEPTLIAQGYVRVYFDGINCFYVPGERGDLARQFALPLNALDGFVRHDPEVAALRTERDRLAAERDALKAAHGRLAASSDAYVAELASLKAAHGRLAIESAALRTGRDGLAAELAALKADHGRLAASSDAYVAELATLKAAHGRLAMESAALRAERDGLAAELAALKADHGRLAASSDAYVAELASLKTAHGRLAMESAALRTGRDGLAFELAALGAKHSRLIEALAEMQGRLDRETARGARLAVYAGERHRLVRELTWPDGPLAVRVVLPVARLLRWLRRVRMPPVLPEEMEPDGANPRTGGMCSPPAGWFERRFVEPLANGVGRVLSSELRTELARMESVLRAVVAASSGAEQALSSHGGRLDSLNETLLSDARALQRDMRRLGALLETSLTTLMLERD